MDFAPYQDESPEIERALSPPAANLRSPRGSPPVQYPGHFTGTNGGRTTGFGNTHFGRDVEGGRLNLEAFDTSLPIRVDVEAMLAYLLLPPAGSVFLLLVEHKSDYVRYVKDIIHYMLFEPFRDRLRWLMVVRCSFHAWQSSMVFTALFVRILYSFSRLHNV